MDKYTTRRVERGLTSKRLRQAVGGTLGVKIPAVSEYDRELGWLDGRRQVGSRQLTKAPRRRKSS